MRTDLTGLVAQQWAQSPRAGAPLPRARDDLPRMLGVSFLLTSAPICEMGWFFSPFLGKIWGGV